MRNHYADSQKVYAGVVQYSEEQPVQFNYWKKTLPGTFITVDYESLVTNQAEESAKLLRFLDLPWEEPCLLFHQNSSTVATASKIQVKQGIYTSAVDRWKDYADYLGPLLPLTELCGDSS